MTDGPSETAAHETPNPFGSLSPVTPTQAGAAEIAAAARVLETKSTARHGPPSSSTLDRAAVAAHVDPLPIAATSVAIRAELETAGHPVLLEGDRAPGAGAAKGEWVAVQGFDASTQSFAVARAGVALPESWSSADLDAFANGRHGGDAIAIASRPEGAASQKLIDAVVAAVPPNMRADARTSVPLILDTAQRAGITDANQVAYVLATAQREARFGQTMHEGGNGKSADGVDHYFDKYEPGTKLGAKLGNTEVGDGERFKGRGYVQVTGRAHAETFSERLGMPAQVAGGTTTPFFVAHPTELERPDVAAQTMVVGMRDGLFTGQQLSDHVNGGAVDFHNARTIVNGHDHAAEIARSAQRYGDAIRSVPLEQRQERASGVAPSAAAPDRLAETREAVDRANQAGVKMTPVQSVEPWQGEVREGRVVRIDGDTYAMHLGRGNYQELSVSRDLGGLAPKDGQMIAIKGPGQAQEIAPHGHQAGHAR